MCLDCFLCIFLRKSFSNPKIKECGDVIRMFPLMIQVSGSIPNKRVVNSIKNVQVYIEFQYKTLLEYLLKIQIHFSGFNNILGNSPM